MQLRFVDNFTQEFLVSANMSGKTSLLKPLFKGIFQFCSIVVILQILVKKTLQTFVEN